MISRSRSDFWCFHRDVLSFVLVFWLMSNGIFRSLPSGKLVSQTSQLGIRPTLPTVQTRGAHPQRSRQTTPLHSTSNAGSVPKRWLARVLLIPPVRCVGVARQFIVIWFDHTQPSPGSWQPELWKIIHPKKHTLNEICTRTGGRGNAFGQRS